MGVKESDSYIITMDDKLNKARWYVMRTVASNVHKSIRTRLEEEGIRYFQPAHWIVREKDGKKYRLLVPIVSNIFFVHDVASRIEPLTQDGSRFQFYYNRCSGKQSDRLVVPDKQMEDFIRVYESTAEAPHIFSPDDEQFRQQLVKGGRVRIIGGPLDGVEGTFVRLSGFRSRRIVVVLEGLMGISAEVEPDLVEVL